MSPVRGVDTAETNMTCKWSLVAKGGWPVSVRVFVVAHSAASSDTSGDLSDTTVSGLVRLDSLIRV